MRKMKIAAAVLLLAAAGCRRQETVRPAAAASEPAPVQATVLKLAPQAFPLTVPITGTLVASTRVDVKAEITGRVVRFDKKEGDRVAAGETVAWVNEENYTLAVRQADGGVQVAQAALERARVLEAHSRAELERAQNLLSSGGITDKDLQAARVAGQEARAQVGLLDAQLEQARAAAAVARKHLRDCQIKSPVAGEIQRKFINAGAYVEPPTPVFSLVDNSLLDLETPVPAADLASVARGRRVAFRVNSYPGESFEGSVEEVNPAVETDSRAARVRIRVVNRGGRLKAGMFAQGEIVAGTRAGAIVVPAAAVYRDDRSAKQSAVFVLENGRAVRRQVRIGAERETDLEIIEGLKPGDALVAEQSIELAEGVRVVAR